MEMQVRGIGRGQSIEMENQKSMSSGSRGTHEFNPGRGAHWREYCGTSNGGKGMRS